MTMTNAEVFDAAAVRMWIADFAERISLNRERLTELDSAIGDADHGLNLDRGMRAVLDALGDCTSTGPAALFTMTGRTLVSKVGGASGPLYGTLFLRMGLACGAAEQLDAQLFAHVLRAGLVGVIDRGKAATGDKTMVDALAPACDALDDAISNGTSLQGGLAAAVAAANAGRENTAQMIARRGRASYLGARSLGHQDPGAASATLLVEAAAATCAREPFVERVNNHDNHYTLEAH